jgi:hypothetical protein
LFAESLEGVDEATARKQHTLSAPLIAGIP